jgi:hypothetical protein
MTEGILNCKSDSFHCLEMSTTLGQVERGEAKIIDSIGWRTIF